MEAHLGSVYLSIVVQPILFLAIPFVWWLITARRQENFFRWLGWYKPGDRPWRAIRITLALWALFGIASVIFVYTAAGKNAASMILHGLGWAGVPAALGYGLLQTAFAEESVFRGFLLKRIAARFGFATGNTVQAVLFGLVHFVGLIGPLGLGWASGIFVFTAALGACFGYVNEKFANGSIVPSWIGHALANTATGLLAVAGII